MVAGMVSGGVSVLSSLRGATFIWVILLVLPQAITCFGLDDVWLLFGACSLLFMITQLSSAQNAHARFLNLVEMDFRNQALLESLRTSNRELESARDEAMRAAQV